MPYYAGPFRVIENVGANAFKLELTMELLERKVRNVFNVSQLKKYHSATPFLNQVESADLPPEDELPADEPDDIADEDEPDACPPPAKPATPQAHPPPSIAVEAPPPSPPPQAADPEAEPASTSSQYSNDVMLSQFFFPKP